MAFDMDLEVDEYDIDISSTSVVDGEEGELPEIDFDALGINPALPTAAKPGSEQKVFTLAARYAAGLPLWHDEDCIDHGPAGIVDED